MAYQPLPPPPPLASLPPELQRWLQQVQAAVDALQKKVG